MGEADLNKERLELALEAAGLDLWENDLITGNVTRKATKTFEELGFTEDEIVSGVQDIYGLFHPDDETSMGHIELSRWADLVVVAPATAGLIAT